MYVFKDILFPVLQRYKLVVGVANDSIGSCLIGNLLVCGRRTPPNACVIIGGCVMRIWELEGTDIVTPPIMKSDPCPLGFIIVRLSVNLINRRHQIFKPLLNDRYHEK